ncbi:NAD/NADP octopine/nopaline dehydrogenase family protein [Lutispora sp.]|uniref:NAD/NADP octopine/nopaline dehydrogenase family protein n=1 Tax=Lutispora sp. TaxID=2828727 RepID=UPI002B2112F1|nr:NAD/NADP octopine/nopaline dehydrogenase family protein [Lutispora sp.]MEA4962998.1 NAD/NADP octopine/nopaline dehydrogenase family protein [Lutispora sp.]
MRITILGAGNGAVAAAAHMTLLGHAVTMTNRKASSLAALMEDGHIDIKGDALVNQRVCIHKVETDICQAIRDAEVIMVCVPSIGHEFYAAAVAPVLSEKQLVMLNPGHMGGALQFAGYLRKNGYTQKLNLCETNTLTYVTRLVDAHTIGIHNIVGKAYLASIPANNKDVEKIMKMYPSLERVPNVLYTAMADLNAVMHPPAMLLNAALIERTGGDFTIYNEGTSPAVATLIRALDEERLQVASALGIHIDSFLDMFYNWGFTTKEAFDQDSIYLALKQSKPNKDIKSPSTLQDRYISEDVGNGLVPMSLIGDIVGVPTPIMDSFIELCSRINGINYMAEGLTLEKLGISGAKNAEGLKQIIADIE